MKREREPVGAEREQQAADNHAGRRALLREQQAERGDADRRPGDLPFALEAIGEKITDQRTDRRRDGDDESIGQSLVTSMPCEINSAGTQLENP